MKPEEIGIEYIGKSNLDKKGNPQRVVIGDCFDAIRLALKAEREKTRNKVEWLKEELDNHRKSNELWRIPPEETLSLIEDWIDKAFKGER